jgi:hypothetical protein
MTALIPDLSATSDAALTVLLRAALEEAGARLKARLDREQPCGWAWEDLSGHAYPTDCALVQAFDGLDSDAQEAAIEVATHAFNGDLGEYVE